MEETKANILVWLEKEYSKTRWPFHLRVKITNNFGEHANQALTELFKEGVVCPRDGAAGPLVQYVIDEKTREKVRNYFLKTNKQREYESD